MSQKSKHLKFLFAIQIGILSPKSYVGPGSLGEELSKQFQKKCSECVLKFVTGAEHAGLEGRLRMDHLRHRKLNYDFVWGMPEYSYQVFKNSKILAEGFPFERGVLAIIVDTNRFPQEKWPKRWSELEKTMGKNLIVQNPQMSAPGEAWLEAVYFWKLLEAKNLKKIQKRIFPSWSSSYEAFTKGEGLGVWSYVTSEAYHRCEEAKENFRALPLEEGYPVQINYFAMLRASNLENQKWYPSLRDLILSKDFQKQIPKKNWMYPIEDSQELLPECFKSLPKIKELRVGEMASGDQRKQWQEKWIVQ